MEWRSNLSLVAVAVQKEIRRLNAGLVTATASVIDFNRARIVAPFHGDGRKFVALTGSRFYLHPKNCGKRNFRVKTFKQSSMITRDAVFWLDSVVAVK